MSIGYSKDQQLNHGRLRPKKESTFGKVSKPLKQTRMKPKRVTNDEELDYLNWSKKQKYVCFVCGTKKNIEIHHVKLNSSDRKDHKKLIPVCATHHRLSNELSVHSTPKKWRETFSIEVQEAYALALYEEYKMAKKWK